MTIGEISTEIGVAVQKFSEHGHTKSHGTGRLPWDYGDSA